MKRALILTIAGLTAMLSGAALAQNAPQAIGEYRDWSAWVYRNSGTKVCYITSSPTETLPRGVNRGDIHFYVSHRPDQGVTGEISMILGYPFAENEEAIARIGGSEFGMRTDGERAWTADPADDSRFVNAMKAGRDMKVEGLSSRGTKTTDTYSLLGFTAAYDAIGKACN
ncbi:MAG: invasion associated locus B family protein [Minwuia sp.]|uniref:invasion associated locus B family protein n=1 Tax=Minwuia sp. TaxID=2493630 RepID=UPI003A851A57